MTPLGNLKTLGTSYTVMQGHIPRKTEPSPTLPQKCKHLHTCGIDCGIPSIQTEAFEMPVASGVPLAVQV
jgi:hypothetical protein